MSLTVQKDAFLYSFYSLQTALHNPIPQRQRKVAYGSVSARGCNYSLLALLMMIEGITRNMYSNLQGIKTVQTRILLDNY
jgi:hypothetical protein